MAKTVAAVAQAAAAPQTSQPPAASRKAAVADTPEEVPARRRTPAAVGRVLPKRAAATNFGNRAQHLKRSVWQPLAVFSGALWLRVTGTFFALIASTMGAAAWRQRFDLYGTAGAFAAHRFWVFALFTALFGYFAVSSFLRANLKERGAQLRR